jgi:CDP-diacylglycerol---serine O-phosphatidyltransferase
MFDRFHPRYLVPNTVTATSMVIAMIAIVQASHGAHESAAWLIVWCALLDRADGFLARLVNAGSDFGVQFDSLADLLAFCVAPAMFVYFLLTSDPRYAPTVKPSPARALLLASVGAYAVLGAARLARFNVQTQRLGPKWSRGLPVPIAGGLVATFVLASWELSLPAWVVAASPVVLLVAAVFMASNLWLPRSFGEGKRSLVALQVLGATAVYGFGITQTLPAFLLAAALAYPIVGFIVGYFHPPTLLECET